MVQDRFSTDHYFHSLDVMMPAQPRFHQKVEYAMEAISNAGTAMGILAKDGIVLAAEKKILSKMLDKIDTTHEKLFTISDDLICAVAGITSDANTLIDYARLTYQRHQYTYQEPMPVEQLVQAVCNMKQSYTQHGGMRPFGTAFLWAGWDKVFGYQLYHSDPSGNYAGWKAHCIGAGSAAAQTILKADYSEDMTVADIKRILVKVLGKLVEGSGSISGENLELAILQRNEQNDSTSVQLFNASEINAMVKEIQSTTMETA